MTTKTHAETGPDPLAAAAEALAAVPCAEGDPRRGPLARTALRRLRQADALGIRLAADAAEALEASAHAAEVADHFLGQARDGIRHELGSPLKFLPGRDPGVARIRPGWGLDEARRALGEDLRQAWLASIPAPAPDAPAEENGFRLLEIPPRSFLVRIPSDLTAAAKRAAEALRTSAGGPRSVPEWDAGLPDIEEMRGILKPAPADGDRPAQSGKETGR